MSAPDTSPAVTSPTTSSFGRFLLFRAVPALVIAAVITFNANHAIILGQLTFMAFAFVISPLFLMAAFTSGLVSGARRAFVAMAVLAVVAAAVSAITIGQGQVAFTLTVGLWAALSGLLELFAGWVSTDRAQSREMLLLGGLTAVFGLVEAVIPLSDLYAVGLLGAYAAILGVFSAIAGFSFGFGASARTNKKAN